MQYLRVALFAVVGIAFITIYAKRNIVGRKWRETGGLNQQTNKTPTLGLSKAQVLELPQGQVQSPGPVPGAADTECTPSPPITNLFSRNIFYNRIEKCASRSMLNVARALGEQNNFTSEAGGVYIVKVEGDKLKEEQAKLTSMVPPTFYFRHIFYVDYTGYPVEQRPILMNIVRDPIERFVSHYNYKKYGDERTRARHLFKTEINSCVEKEEGVCNRADRFMFNIGMYFCGMDKICEDYTSHERVELAKKHIDLYTFIGSAEEFTNSLLLLEKMLPEYFSGALDVWDKLNAIERKTKTKKKEFLTEESTKKLRRFMKHEYEVYYYAMQKYEELKLKYCIS